MSKKKKEKKKHTILKLFLLIILLVIVLCAGFTIYSTYKNGWGVTGLIQTAMGQDEQKLEELEPINVLILGISQDISAKLTDTIIVASYNPKTQKASLISIPRDTFVGNDKKKATSYDKINALYQSSPEKTLDAVNKITGLNIIYYVVVSNNALVELVDTIGGVEFDVPIDMNYDDSSQDLYIHLKKGFQKLNGEQAEWLVRFRKNNNGTSYPTSYGDNDLGRMKTQREFLKEVAKQTLKLKNITKLGEFADILKRNITTNISNWSMLKSYLSYAIEFDTQNIRMENIPGDAKCFGPYNLWFFEYDKQKTLNLVKDIFEEQNGTNEEESVDSALSTAENSEASQNTPTSRNNASIKIEILNGTENSKLLSQATNNFKKLGYNVYKTGSTNLTSKTTIVIKKDVPNENIEEIKNAVGIDNAEKHLISSSKVDITIILGEDYK